MKNECEYCTPLVRCKDCKWRDECFRNIRNDGNRDGMTEIEQVYQASMRQIEAGYALDDRGKAIRAYVASLVTGKDVGGKDGKDKEGTR